MVLVWFVQECLRQCQEQIEESLRSSLTGSTSDRQQQSASKHRSEPSAAAQPATPTDVRDVLIDDQ